MIHNLNMSCFYGPSLLVGATFIVAPNVATETLVSILKKHPPTWSYLVRPDHRAHRRRRARRLDRFQASPRHHHVEQCAASRAMVGAGLSSIRHDGRHPDGNARRRSSRGDRFHGGPSLHSHRIACGSCGRAPKRLSRPMKWADRSDGLHVPGYFDAEERNREAFTSDGAYRSGDLCASQESTASIISSSAAVSRMWSIA